MGKRRGKSEESSKKAFHYVDRVMLPGLSYAVKYRLKQQCPLTALMT